MIYHSLEEIYRLTIEQKKPFWKIIMEDDMLQSERSREQSFAKMQEMYLAMKNADREYDGERRSYSKRAGGDGEKFQKFLQQENHLCGPFIGLAMEKAIKMAESNACMRRIVAAPTAGSCGVIPAILISYQELFGRTDEEMVEALFVAAGIGKVIAENASISGAAGGCQAEIGSASAMAAGALTYLCGGDAYQINQASALALKNMLGLACDPVCGLVEVPCIKRNASGAVNAVTASQLALAGIKSAIAPDEVIESMKRIGEDLPKCLKETGEGGLAVTGSAQNYMKTIRVVAAIICREGTILTTQRGYGEFAGGWEFPGGKLEPGEGAAEALVREIKEELDTTIAVGELLDTIEYDYPSFHLSMDCFLCTLTGEEPVLKEHSQAKWIGPEELDTVEWLPADITIIEKLKKNWPKQVPSNK